MSTRRPTLKRTGDTLQFPPVKKPKLTEKQQDYKRLQRITQASAAPLQKSYRTVLSYAAKVTFSSAVSTSVNVFRGNSCYDPDYTGAGAQPVGFDQLSTLYGTYKVHGSKIKVMALPGGTAITTQRILFVQSGRDPSELSGDTSAQIWATPRIKKKFLGQIYTDPAYITDQALTATTYGVKDLDDMGFQAVPGANPGNEWYWVVGCVSCDDSSTFSSVNQTIYVEILYDVEFFNPNELDLS